ncbi:Cytochrome b-c1 complex subunit Rieske mitochondrial, partial [Bienertia sinuspersici]
ELNNKLFYLTCIYGFNGREERKPLWAALQSLSSHIGQVPWCVAGDFNAVAMTKAKSHLEETQQLLHQDPHNKNLIDQEC